MTWEDVKGVLAVAAFVGVILIAALTETLRRVFFTRRAFSYFENNDYKELKNKVDITHNLTLGNQDAIAHNRNSVDRLSDRLDVIEEFGSIPSRELREIVIRIDKRLALLAARAGIKDEGDDE